MQQISTNALAFPLPHPASLQNDASLLFHTEKRLALLLPDLVQQQPDNLYAYARAYIQRYHHDILQLEHEWDVLSSVAVHAWQHKEYEVAVDIVAGIAHLASRQSDKAATQHLLSLGIQAGAYAQQHADIACLQMQLGSLLFAQGKYHQGRTTWHAGIETVLSTTSSARSIELVSHFACIMDILGSYGAAQQFVETVTHNTQLATSTNLAVATFIRGLYARLTDNIQAAYEDFCQSLQLLAQPDEQITYSSYKQLLLQAIQAELARVQGDYECSQEHTENALLLARMFSDAYTVSALLADQGLFTYQQHRFTDMQAVILRLQDIAPQLKTPHIYHYCHYLETRLKNALGKKQSIRFLTSASTEPCEPLSKREVEVLKLVAEGLSNRDIALRLVIAPSTVKKHLEHIYARLNAHNRTSALAQARLHNFL